ncbi:unnamed protein product, partial [Staurois parvus]
FFTLIAFTPIKAVKAIISPLWLHSCSHLEILYGDWSQLVTWYKAVVNSLVPCDLCDHSQISHVISNDVRSDILLTTLFMANQ